MRVDPEEYNFQFPASLIAQSPAHPRDSARLLVYDRKSKVVELDTFKNLVAHLPSRAVIVFNETKVVPARFFVHKPTGGKVELLYTGKSLNTFDALANRPLNVGDVLGLSSGSSPREERLGEVIVKNDDGSKATTTSSSSSSRGGGQGAVSVSSGSSPKMGEARKGMKQEYQIVVTKKLSKGYRFKSSFPISDLFSILEKYGVTPIPPYIKNSTLAEKKLRSEYQTVFAKSQGSSAAPTASLHFTSSLLTKLKKAGIAIEYVTLHVGLGTFAPLTERHIQTRKLHKEWYEISSATAKRLEKYKKQGRPIVAVGTTVVRTLESTATTMGKLSKLSGETEIFIYPPYTFKFVDSLITNFHVPKSSLMMLVASLIGREKLLELYALAVKKKFRLFSFGDGMLIK